MHVLQSLDKMCADAHTYQQVGAVLSNQLLCRWSDHLAVGPSSSNGRRKLGLPFHACGAGLTRVGYFPYILAIVLLQACEASTHWPRSHADAKGRDLK